MDKLLRLGVAAILILVPFHALLTVWLSSVAGHYDLLRLWKELLLVVLVVVSGYQALRDKQLRMWLVNNWVVRLASLFIAVTTVSAVIALLVHQVDPKAVGYGLIVDLRPVIFMLVIFVMVRRGQQLRWAKLLVVPAMLVVAFALLQFFVLPKDVLRHFGYGPDTIISYQTVDNTADFPRLQSSLRGPNPLGAYLIPVLTLLVLGLAYLKEKRLYSAAILMTVFVIVMTFSRSAFVGAALAIGLLMGWTVQRPSARRLFWTAICGVVIIGGIGFVVLRTNDAVQKVFFHTSDTSTSPDSSNSKRGQALLNGVKDIVREPLGGGVGSAGPASVHNSERSSRISENFFLQIGQESGVIGLASYLALIGMIAYKLWERRQHGIVRAALAAFIGLIFVNLLSHAWADDTLAYISWGLLAACLSKSNTPPTVENY